MYDSLQVFDLPLALLETHYMSLLYFDDNRARRTYLGRFLVRNRMYLEGSWLIRQSYKLGNVRLSVFHMSIQGVSMKYSIRVQYLSRIFQPKCVLT